MTKENWEFLVGKKVRFPRGGGLKLLKLIGCGGSGAVFDVEYCRDKVIKLLDPESPVARQELKSLDAYCARSGYFDGVLKFGSPRGTLSCDGNEYTYYVMRKGKTLRDAIDSCEEWLKDPQRIMHLTAHLIQGVSSLKEMGLSHGDIKEDNILLLEYGEQIFPVLADYGLVSDRRVPFSTPRFRYDVAETEYDSELEAGIAYDLHCIEVVLSDLVWKVFNLPDAILLDGIPMDLRRILRTLRDTETPAYERLKKLGEKLKFLMKVPVSLHLAGVPQLELNEEFPFEEVMRWGEYPILRDKNLLPGEPFDPLLLMKIPKWRYEQVISLIGAGGTIDDFVMPIARYTDKEGNDYVLIHAPDDKNKRRLPWRRFRDELQFRDDPRIQDERGIPHTLTWERSTSRKREMEFWSEKMIHLGVSVEIAPEDIWHMDRPGRRPWKLNLFSVKFLEAAPADAEICRITWKSE